MKYLSVKQRFFILIFNSSIAYGFFIWATGRYLPGGGIESIWFISAISLWFLMLLSSPWFLPPRDTFISAFSTLLVLVSLDFGQVVVLKTELELLRNVLYTYPIFVIALSLTALFLYDGSGKSRLGSLAYKIGSVFGRGEMLFSLPAILSLVGGFGADLPKLNILLLMWMFIVVIRPVYRFAEALNSVQSEFQGTQNSETAGHIDRVDHPNIVRVKLVNNHTWKPGRLFTARLPDENQKYVISLFSQVQGAEVVGTGLCVAELAEEMSLQNGEVVETHDEEKTAEFLEKLSGFRGAQLVGFIVENSNINAIKFEVAATADLSEGDVVFARLSGKEVMYQIVDAETAEESFDSNPRGTHIVHATQIGTYSPEHGFQKYSWLPKMNTPLFAAKELAFQQPVLGERDVEIGRVPSSNVNVLANIDELVEYHSAILGVTGTGKTELALDLARKAHEKGMKVFCVDFTGDYRARLADLNPIFPAPDAEKAKLLEGMIFTIDAYGFKAAEVKENLKKQLDAIRDETKVELEAFLTSDENSLAIFELADIANSKASLRLTEIYLSAIMNWARENRKSKQILICLEEAHTIIPEVYGSGFDGETKWVVERIGQIALQGRKFGVGLMVISQRTALVSKTILSQCNSFFTHALIDQTSLTFLGSVYSAQHTKLIPNLGKFEFLAYGKALKSERPILVKREFDPEIQKASEALNHKPFEVEAVPEVAPEAANEDGNEAGEQ